MNDFQELLLVVAVNGCVFAAVFFALYELNKAARPSGR